MAERLVCHWVVHLVEWMDGLSVDPLAFQRAGKLACYSAVCSDEMRVAHWDDHLAVRLVCH